MHIALVLDYCRFAAISLLSSTDKQDVPLIFFFGCYPSLGRRLLARVLIFMCLALTNARSAWKLYIHVRMHKAYVCMYVWHEHEQSRWTWTCCRYDQCVACLQGSANIHALPCLAFASTSTCGICLTCTDEAACILYVSSAQGTCAIYSWPFSSTFSFGFSFCLLSFNILPHMLCTPSTPCKPASSQKV